MTCPHCDHYNDRTQFYQIFGTVIYKDDKRCNPDYTELFACPECKKLFIDDEN